MCHTKNNEMFWHLWSLFISKVHYFYRRHILKESHHLFGVYIWVCQVCSIFFRRLTNALKPFAWWIYLYENKCYILKLPCYAICIIVLKQAWIILPSCFVRCKCSHFIVKCGTVSTVCLFYETIHRLLSWPWTVSLDISCIQLPRYKYLVSIK